MERERLLSALWRTNKVWPLLLGGLLLANLATLAWILLVASPQVEELERAFIQRQSQLRQTGPAAEQPASVSALAARAESDLRQFRESIPSKLEFSELLRELFALAEGAGLSIERISYDPKAIEERGVLRYSLVFSVAGNYGQLKKFVHSLEQSPRIIALEEMALSGAGERRAGEVQLRLRFSTYFHTRDAES